MIANMSTTLMLPISPSSSPMTAKMKSVWASGRPPHFSRLAPRPVPNNPPVASPYWPWMIW